MRIVALGGLIFGLLALIFAIIALDRGRWENDTHADYFRSSIKHDQLRLPRITCIISLIFTSIGILASFWITLRSFSHYWNLLPSSFYLLGALTLLLTMAEASRVIHHDTWSAYIYAISFAFLLVACQLMAGYAGDRIFSHNQ